MALNSPNVIGNRIIATRSTCTDVTIQSSSPFFRHHARKRRQAERVLDGAAARIGVLVGLPVGVASVAFFGIKLSVSVTRLAGGGEVSSTAFLLCSPPASCSSRCALIAARALAQPPPPAIRGIFPSEVELGKGAAAVEGLGELGRAKERCFRPATPASLLSAATRRLRTLLPVLLADWRAAPALPLFGIKSLLETVGVVALLLTADVAAVPGLEPLIAVNHLFSTWFPSCLSRSHLVFMYK